jgi:thioredoxin reductase
VLGGTPGAARYAQIVRAVDPRPRLLHAADTLSELERSELVARAIGVVEGTVEQLVIDDDRLRGVQMSDGRVVPRDALFVPPRFVPNNALVLGLGCDVDDEGWVVADATGRTSVDGVWVAGNWPTRGPR